MATRLSNIPLAVGSTAARNSIIKASSTPLGRRVLKDNWPYIQDGPKVAEAKRVEADIGTSSIDRRRLSGYTILLTDVTDSGQTTNIRIVDSWPEVGYQKASKAALAKWQYAPKTGSEPAGFRKDIAVPFTFIVYDRDSQDTY